MNSIREGRDYKFVIPEDDGISVNVELLSGEYSGVVYNYGKVSFEEDDETQQGYLVFEYDVIESNNFESLKEDDNFKNRIGDILTTIITNNMEKNPSEVISE